MHNWECYIYLFSTRRSHTLPDIYVALVDLGHICTHSAWLAKTLGTTGILICGYTLRHLELYSLLVIPFVLQRRAGGGPENICLNSSDLPNIIYFRSSCPSTKFYWCLWVGGWHSDNCNLTDLYFVG
jgi:hypothetical protein